DTTYDGEELVIDHLLEHNVVYFAYFVPYSYEQHQDLIQEAQMSPLCEVQDLGITLDGRDMSLLVIGHPSEGKRNIWITARQHPGETMAEWFVEGMLERLLDPDDAVARHLLSQAVFYVVPNMNPDGGVRGHLRTNAAGANLNREWLEPSMQRSPEVFNVREKMKNTGVDLFLDIHGDETIPYNFAAGADGVPSFDAHHKQLQDRFKAALLLATPEFQTEHGYPANAPGSANLSLAGTWVGEHFKCLSYTIEMPFKDNNDLPEELYGWSEVRSMQFGRDSLAAIRAVVSHLR
ncbi:MAG: M14 family zinc carboxypeptidase, partial [Natronospirillum sp.]